MMKVGEKNHRALATLMVAVVVVLALSVSPNSAATANGKHRHTKKLRFRRNGQFKILQVADMHYADGKTTKCLDVLPCQMAGCSDLNTTAFLKRIIAAEKPDLIAFTGDNIFGMDCTHHKKSMNAAFAPAIESNIPWVAVLGNHDQETKTYREGTEMYVNRREETMKHIVTLKNTLSLVNPPDVDYEIYGFGNYNLEVGGVKGSDFEDKSVLNLYFLDSGDSAKYSNPFGYDWIQPSQQLWFLQTSARLGREYMNEPEAQKVAAPGLSFFHIPLPEYGSFDSSNSTGVKQEPFGAISSADWNSGLFSSMLVAGDVKSVFVGHDHLNDFCGELMRIQLCYAGGFGYHAYGMAGWKRRARVIVASLEKNGNRSSWGGVGSIRTWKTLDDERLTSINGQVLWNKTTDPKYL